MYVQLTSCVSGVEVLAILKDLLNLLEYTRDYSTFLTIQLY